MNIKTILKILTTIIAATTLTACYKNQNLKGDAHLIELLKKEKPVAISFISRDGQFIVADAVSGEIIPPTCPKEDYALCGKKNLFKLPAHNVGNTGSTRYTAKSKSKSPMVRNSGDIILSVNDDLTIKEQMVIEIITWTGSYCITYISRSAGEERTLCHGNE